MQLLGRVAAIWRYPVKSLRAQPLESIAVDARGLLGDRTRALIVRSGHARSGKTYRGKEQRLLHTIGDEREAQTLAASAGARVETWESAERFFDAAPVSIVFDSWIAEVSRHLGAELHPLRWRPNFYVLTEPGCAYAEDDLSGAELDVGGVRLRVRSPINRCVVPNYDPLTGEPDDRVLRFVAGTRANRMGIYCDVLAAGDVRAGDALRLRARPTSRTIASSSSI